MEGELTGKVWGTFFGHTCEVVGAVHNTLTVQTKSPAAAEALRLRRYNHDTFRGQVPWSDCFRAWIERHAAVVDGLVLPVAYISTDRVLVSSSEQLDGFWPLAEDLWVRWLPRDQIDRLHTQEFTLKGTPSQWFSHSSCQIL